MVKTKKIHHKANYRSQKDSSPNSVRHESLASTGDLDLLYGKHAVLSALANPRRQFGRLILTTDTNHNFFEKIEKALSNGGHSEVNILTLDKKNLDNQLPAGAVHQGIALEARALKYNLDDIINQTSRNDEATIILLDQATDTHNIGSILRSAAAFGATAVIIQDRNSPITNGTIAKAASGALEHVAIVRTTNLVRAMNKLKTADYWCVGLEGKAIKTITEVRLPRRVVLVLGSEGNGLRRLTRQNCDMLVKVPISKTINSLNLSNAAAIALYEKSKNEYPKS